MSHLETVPIAVSIVIPAYNEAGRIVPTLAATESYIVRRNLPCEILVVDDGSTDDTVLVVEAWGSARQTDVAVIPLRVLGYGANRGKGHAVRYGVLRASGARVLFMDADLATPIEEMEKLEAALDNGVAFAIGSRPLKDSQLLVRQPWYREAAGRLFNKLVQVMATPGIHDTQCGFKMLTHAAAQDIFGRCTLDGFAFDIEALYIARRLGYPIAEVPVRWAHQPGAAAFATKGAYLRHGLRMVRELQYIRRAHRSLRSSAPTPANSNIPNIPKNSL